MELKYLSTASAVRTARALASASLVAFNSRLPELVEMGINYSLEVGSSDELLGRSEP